MVPTVTAIDSKLNAPLMPAPLQNVADAAKSRSAKSVEIENPVPGWLTLAFCQAQKWSCYARLEDVDKAVAMARGIDVWSR